MTAGVVIVIVIALLLFLALGTILANCIVGDGWEDEP